MQVASHQTQCWNIEALHAGYVSSPAEQHPHTSGGKKEGSWSAKSGM
jgi:hypothetical protein